MAKNSWDTYWGRGDSLEYWQKPAQVVIELAKATDPRKQPSVLDLGCGIGRHAVLFAKAGFNVTAVDGSKEAIDYLKGRSHDLSLDLKMVVGDYRTDLFRGASFDLIVAYNALYHGFQADFRRAIGLCRKYLKEDGLFFFTCPSRRDAKYGTGTEVAPHTYRSENSIHSGDIHYFTHKEELGEVLAGMEIRTCALNEYYWQNQGKKQFSSNWEVLVKKTGLESCLRRGMATATGNGAGYPLFK